MQRLKLKPHRRPLSHSSRGFSLVELVVALAVALVLSANAIPNIVSTYNQYRLGVQATLIANELDQLRMIAVRRNTTITLYSTPGSPTVLFIDARHIYRQIDRAHSDWTDAQISFLANVVRLYLGEAPDFTLGGKEAETKLLEVFGTAGKSNLQSAIRNPQYKDIAGLCKAATLKEIEAQGWSLNPGR